MNPLVLIPSYNSGPCLARTVASAAKEWAHVWVVVDGSDDGSDGLAEKNAPPGVQFIRLSDNRGKGGAVLEGLRLAEKEEFTHALVMDSDSQHPAGLIRRFFEIGKKNPEALVCGVPLFGPDAPVERVKWRLLGNFLVMLETLGVGPEDALFGFRLYPVAPALRVLEGMRGARRFDFDTVMAVRMVWSGVPCINISAPVVYPQGGVTHFRYLRDNALLAMAHIRLLAEWLWRMPGLFGAGAKP